MRLGGSGTRNLWIVLSTVMLSVGLGSLWRAQAAHPVNGEPAAIRQCLPPPLTASSETRFHGFCRCTCSRIPDCNTSADCGGGPCMHAISCC